MIATHSSKQEFVMSLTSLQKLQQPIEFLKGVGPLRADLLKKELGIFTYEDLLNYFPFRHIDRTRVSPISELKQEEDFAQVAGVVLQAEVIGQRASKRLVVQFKDKTGIMELTWFKGINWIQKSVQSGQSYLVFGRLSFFNGRPQFVHPEIERVEASQSLEKNYLEPVYSTTEKLKARGLGGRQLAKLSFSLFSQLTPHSIPEIFPANL